MCIPLLQEYDLGFIKFVNLFLYQNVFTCVLRNIKNNDLVVNILYVILFKIFYMNAMPKFVVPLLCILNIVFTFRLV